MTPKIQDFLSRERPATPCLVVDLDAVAAAYRQISALAPWADIFYAVKANPAPEILKTLCELGASYDAASPTEIDACLAAGATPDRISYGNTVKKVSDIKTAVDRGIRLFAFDSAGEAEKLAVAAPGARVFCRIVVENHGARWPLSRKFGCPIEFAVENMKLAADRGLDPAGLSFHVGSQQYDATKWREAIQTCAELFDEARKVGLSPNLINLGGGYPVQYRDEDAPTLEAVFEEITSALDDTFGKDLPQIIIEPGRALVAAAGAIDSEVILVADRAAGAHQRWVYLDIGRYGGLAEAEGEAIQYKITAPGKNGPTEPSVLAGPTCDGHDILYEHARYDLPASLTAGDHVIINGTGAYTTTYSSVNFNGFSPLAEHYI